MIVCICNALREREIERNVSTGGVQTVDDVFSAAGCEARCGTCVPEIEGMLLRKRPASSATNEGRNAPL
ncbi:MAG TPA: (2Fe-2S)-binding protein [Candidatus Sulfotelmatobacter sp.]|nr:(2Fe-2S)-binding protein [Candidatus Sulfotelmatobacter sp.]